MAYVEIDTFTIYCPACHSLLTDSKGSSEWTPKKLQSHIRGTHTTTPTCKECGQRFYLPTAAHLTQ